MRKLLLLMAVLAIALPEAARSVTTDQSNSYNRHGVSLKLMDPSGSVYQQGESVRFVIDSDTDAYVLVFNIDTEGFVNVLYPRNAQSIQRILGGRTYYIPPDFDQELLITGKTGIEFAFAVAINDRSAIDDAQIAEMLQDETRPVGQRFRITGDPFLAANRIASRLVKGIAYTRDESMAFTYFYVNEAVEFPRYLCRDCADRGVDPYAAQHDWVATTAFDREDRLSYPLKAAFARPEAQVSSSQTNDSDTPVVINNYYTNRYPYYPGYYYPTWGSSFYFSIGWNWGYWGGWGWGYPWYWGYPRYRAGWAYCSPYASPYYGGYYGGHRRGDIAHRPTLRPRTPYRSRGGTAYTPKAATASRLRAKSTRYERSDKVAGGNGGGATVVRAGKRTHSRPVYKVTSRKGTRTGHGTRGYKTRSVQPRKGSGSGYVTHRSKRQVRTIKGQPTHRKSISRSGTSRRYTGKSGSSRITSRQRSTRDRSSVTRSTSRSGHSVKARSSSRGRSTSKSAVKRGSGRSSRASVSRGSGRSVSRGSASRGKSSGRSSRGGRRGR